MSTDKEKKMNTTWRVTKVTEIEGETTAELRQVTWFKTNPEYAAMQRRWDAVYNAAPEGAEDETCEAEFLDVEWPEEFVDCEPGEVGAEFIDAFGKMTLDITDGLGIHAGDNVKMSLDALDRITV